MAIAANLGFPRIGAHRELKAATEAYWKGETDAAALAATAADLRARHWTTQRAAGITVIPSNDFSLYDQMLDMTATLGAVPARFGPVGDEVSLATYFTMARGAEGVPAMEMTKWFDTNYHFIVPEVSAGQSFRLASLKAVREFEEAKALGIHTRPVIIGPVTWLALAKSRTPGLAPLELLPAVLPVYRELLDRLAAAGADRVQVDEPILAADLGAFHRAAFWTAYDELAKAAPKLMVATYFGALGPNLDVATKLPVDGLHVDLVRAPEQLEPVLAALAPGARLSLGVVDGRNVWRASLEAALAPVARAVAVLGTDRVEVAPSCSLLHVPFDAGLEEELDAEVHSWLAFANQKLEEVAALTAAANGDRAAVALAFERSAVVAMARASSRRIHNAGVKARVADVGADDLARRSPYATRAVVQGARLGLPILPTTTIGSFPQTAEVRRARADARKGRITAADYDAFLERETEACVRFQEAAGLDMLVHGEFERNDMVESFGEQLSGFAFTRHGWVQSYGSRCVKPPLIFGDVARPEPMTVRWSRFAQSLTDRPMKGMLTGPVTILQWSFVRDDQPRSVTCRQIALAIRDEVVDLEAAGLPAIQIDEPALREGLPLRRADWKAYLGWAVDAFRLSAAGVRDETQIHTHMCYSEFNDIMPAIARMDADVISIETSRSDMELLAAFADFAYPNEIGPGVWDIHSPRVPEEGEIVGLLRKALAVIPAERLWVNPDCGLKTRGWAEVEAATRNMVAAARQLRASFADSGSSITAQPAE
jgi:5-methyltetrahydropteroyltriglutamate--homocysteine methyltransferase